MKTRGDDHGDTAANRAITRRGLLKAGLVAAGAAALPRSLFAASPSAIVGAPLVPFGASYKTKHVLLVLFAGGVRSRDTIGTPANVPNLMRLASKGVLLPNCGVANLGHYGSSLAILTGVPESMGIRENARGFSPTIFEYVRKELKLPASGAWLSANNGSQGANFAYSLDKHYGAEFGANVIDGDGVFNQEFRDTLAQFGKPKADTPEEFAALERLRATIGAGTKRDARSEEKALNDDATAARVEKYILDELTNNQTASLTGPGAGDAKALRIAGNILQIFRPTLSCVSLTNADVAHGSYNAYVDVIRRNDQELGRILDLVLADKQLADSTTILVLPEFGRDKNLNQRNGLDHGDGSPDLQKVALVAFGPDFKAGKTVDADCNSIDVCPTICKLLGAESPQTRGRPIARLLS
jgi:hypothetical protein